MKKSKRQPPESLMPKREAGAKRPKVQLVADALELPKGIESGLHIEISGNREAVVTGCKSITEYDQDIVQISTGGLQVRFIGASLELRSLSEDMVIIEGRIASVEFI